MFLFSGNKIITPTGPISVLNAGNFPISNQECAKILFSDNTFVVLPFGIKLKTRNGSVEIGNKFKSTKHRRYTHSIYTQKFDFENRTIEPYMIGVAICAKNHQNKLFLKDSPETHQIADFGHYYNIDFKKNSRGRLKIKPKEDFGDSLSSDIVRLNLNTRLNQRHIPEEYLYSSEECRIELLRGLMDINGRCKDNMYLFTSSIQLAKDFAFLVRSLGYFAKIIKMNTKSAFYHVNIKVPFSPFKLTDKFAPYKFDDKFIIGVEKAGIQPCAEIPAESLVINDFLVVS